MQKLSWRGLLGLEVQTANIANQAVTAAKVTGLLGDWADRTVDQVYLAATDGFVTATRYTTAQTSMVGYTDGGTPPTTVRAYQGIATTDDKYQSITFPVKKNNYYKVIGASVVNWIPLGS